VTESQGRNLSAAIHLPVRAQRNTLKIDTRSKPQVTDMIERNLGNTERVLRLIGAILLTAWAAARDNHDVLTPVALLIAAALTLNFLFSRCYLWAVLGLKSCGSSENGCPPSRQY